MMNMRKALLILIILVGVGVLLPLLAEPAPVPGELLEETRSLMPSQTVGESNIFLPVLSRHPIQQWIRNYRLDPNDHNTHIKEMTFASNGDIVWVGDGSNSQDYSVLMGRVQSNGALLWLKGYGNAELYQSSLSTIITASTGGYWIGGSTQVDNVQRDYPWLLRVDEGGTILWQKIYMPPTLYGTEISQIVETSDHGLVVTMNDVFDSVWIAKLTENGTVSWVRDFGTMYDNRSITHLAIDNDGNYVMAGVATSYATGYAGGLTWVVKMNSSGELLWQNIYALSQASSSTNDQPFGLVILNNGNVLVGIRTELIIQGQPNRSFWFVQLNNNGDVVWQKSLQSGSMDIPSMALTPEQDVVVAGRGVLGNSRPWFFRLSSTGTLSWSYFYVGINGVNWHAAAYTVQVSTTGDIYVGGFEGFQSYPGLMLMRLSPQGIVPECDLFIVEPLSSSTPDYDVETPIQLPLSGTLTVTNATVPTWNLVGQTIEICPIAGGNVACDLPK